MFLRKNPFKKKLEERPIPRASWRPGARWIPGLVILMLTVFMGFFEQYFLPIRPPVVGSLSREAVRAPYDFVLNEQEAIEKVIQQELAEFAPVYLYDPKKTRETLVNLSDLFSGLARCREDASNSEKAKACMRGRFQKAPIDRALAELLRYPHLQKLEAMLATFLKERLSTGILPDDFPGEASGRLRIRNEETGETTQWPLTHVEKASRAAELLSDHLEVLDLQPDLRTALKEEMRALLGPNLVYAPENEEVLSQIRARSSQKKLIIYRRGDLLIRSGDVVSLLDFYRVQACLSKSRPNAYLVGSASFIPFLLLTLVFVLVCRRMDWTNRSAVQGFLLLCFVLLSILLLAKAVYLFTNLSAFAIPVAAAGLLVALLIDLPTGLVAALLTAIYTTFLTNLDMGLFIYYLVGSVLMVLCVRRSSKRLVLLAYSLLVGILNVLLLTCTLLLRDELLTLPGIKELSLQAFLSGPAAWLLTVFLVPVGEKLFRLATADRLRELCDLNYPLLRKLQEKAPGSYYHSLAVANLATVAAEAVKADALLVRAGAYYHDIGKIMQPEYFIENRSNKENPHDDLDAVTSSRIVKAHVNDGVAIAREYGFPQAVINLIAEHHGTTVMEAFFSKAHESQPKAPWNRDFFRYDGPKPSSLEAAILMIADVTEAVGRVMKTTNPLEVREKIHELIVKKFEDGQFELCNLPTSTIAMVEAAVTQALLGVLHKRIEYPKNNTRDAQSLAN